LIVVAFFTAMILLTPAFPIAVAHGGHQPPAADFEGKNASLFVKLAPPVVTDSDRTCNSCNYNSCQEDVVSSDGQDVLDILPI
jgi:hypothetical protein